MVIFDLVRVVVVEAATVAEVADVGGEAVETAALHVKILGAPLMDSETRAMMSATTVESWGIMGTECRSKRPNEETNFMHAQEDEPALLLAVCVEETTKMVMLNKDKLFPKLHSEKMCWGQKIGRSMTEGETTC